MAASWLTGERKFCDSLDELFACSLAIKEVGAAVQFVDGRFAKGIGHAGCVHKEVVNRHRPSHFGQFGSVRRPADKDLGLFEGGDELCHGIGELESTFFVQNHRGDSGDGLGHRIDAENGIALEGLAFFKILVADCREVNESTVSRYGG